MQKDTAIARKVLFLSTERGNTQNKRNLRCVRVLYKSNCYDGGGGGCGCE
jgi:hypothetical protein